MTVQVGRESKGRDRPLPVAASIDLGTTRIKGGILGAGGELRVVASRPAPPLEGAGPIRECAPGDYLREARLVIDDLAGSVPDGTPLGIASQRSTFTLWDSPSGSPLMPLVSWQDRRAAPWCAARADIARGLPARTGLRLSPHYAGPKLAAILEEKPALRRAMERGEARFGTIECWVLSRVAPAAPHETDLTMAARTLLADPRSGRWERDLLDLFSVPAAGLPAICPSAGREGPSVGGLRVTASLADQAAAALAVLGGEGDDAMVNLGTGGFVMRRTGAGITLAPGYLSGPVLAPPVGSLCYAVEGTINGVVEALSRFGWEPSPPGEIDPAPGAFCIPDSTGLGAPHWIPERTLSFSPEAAALDDASRRRVVLEGILFRVREILEGLFAGPPPGRIVLCGGIAGERGLAEGLAACLGRPVELLEEPEATLLGAARLAAREDPGDPPPRSRPVAPGPAGRYLPGKWERWREWVSREIQAQ